MTNKREGFSGFSVNRMVSVNRKLFFYKFVLVQDAILNLFPYECIGRVKKTVRPSFCIAYKNYKAAKQLYVEEIILRLYSEVVDYSPVFHKLPM